MTQVEAALTNIAKVNPAIASEILRDIPVHQHSLCENIIVFARLLRQMEIPIGPAQTINAMRAVLQVGCINRTILYWALHCSLITKHQDSEAFALCFQFFWRNPQQTKTTDVVAGLEDQLPAQKPDTPPTSNRLGEALMRLNADRHNTPPPQQTETQAIALAPNDVTGAKDMDFAAMSASEMNHALIMIARMKAQMVRKPTRRVRASHKGNMADWRRTIQRAARNGHGLEIATVERVKKIPPLTILCDISGSMAAYSRIFLHFLHALPKTGAMVNSFVFGTRLYNITKQIRERDVDVALGKITDLVDDWSGGTKIGDNLHEFHQQWTRRVQGQNASTIIITDGLERGDVDQLQKAMANIRRSSRYVIWMNPLMGYSEYAPSARGAKIMAQYVDEYYPLYNITSLERFAQILTNNPMCRK